MELLGIGFFELMLIFIIALIVLGPDEMVRAGATVGRFIRNLRQSEVWRGFQRMSRTMRNFPEEFAREAGIEDLRREIRSSTHIDREEQSRKPPDSEASDLSAWTQIPDRIDNNLSLPPAQPKTGGDTGDTETET